MRGFFWFAVPVKTPLMPTFDSAPKAGNRTTFLPPTPEKAGQTTTGKKPRKSYRRPRKPLRTQHAYVTLFGTPCGLSYKFGNGTPYSTKFVLVK